MKVLDGYPWIAQRFCGVREEKDGEYVSAECAIRCHSSGRLRFWLGNDGRLMFGCWAGCAKLEILRAVGLGWKDTFPAGSDLKQVKQEIVARYHYRDEAGVLLYETVRLEPGRGGKDKDFKQRKPKGAGGWEWSLGDVRRVLYRLPELLAADPKRMVFKVAGEKDADTLHRLGLIATTSVCGERTEWLSSYSELLTGRHVTVIEDRDAVGGRHANEVCGSLLDHGVKSLTRVRLPEKDATAFVNACRVAGIAEADILKQLATVVRASPRWSTKKGAI